MSILVVHLVPEGLLFAADRNVTATRSSGNIERVGQVQRPKVLRWPNRDAILGYVGIAELDGSAMDEWLYSFIGRHLNEESFESLAHALRDDLNDAVSRGAIEDVLVVHLGGFEFVAGEWTPRVWFITNASALTEEGFYELGSAFEASEEIAQPTYFDTKTGDAIRAEMVERVEAWSLFSFRQGFDLGAFNVLDAGVRAAMRAIVETHPLKKHPFPRDLDEWSKHVRFGVLAYGSYFAAFYEPYEQFVGGGADVVSVPWPTMPQRA